MVAAIDLDLGEELPGELHFAHHADFGGERHRAAIVLFGARELAATPAQEPEREQRVGLADGVTDLASDLERLTEVLLGEIPLSEAVPDESQVVIVDAHAGVEPGALVE